MARRARTGADMGFVTCLGPAHVRDGEEKKPSWRTAETLKAALDTLFDE
jgi:hypothetical protein